MHSTGESSPTYDRQAIKDKAQKIKAQASYAKARKKRKK